MSGSAPDGGGVARSALPLLGCLLLATTANSLGYLGNEDFWWTLASGDTMLEQGGIPEHDPFLYTSTDRATWVTSAVEQRTWVTHSWLWSVALALISRVAGLPGIAVLKALGVAWLTTLLFTRARLDRFGLLNAAIVLLALFPSLDRFTPRSELASAILLMVFLWRLDRPRPVAWGGVALLAALQWLWSNLHGGFTLGLLVAGSWSVGGEIGRRAADGAPRAEAPRRCLLPLLVLASLATPGFALERVQSSLGVFAQLAPGTSREMASLIEEWQPTFAAGLAGPAWIYVLVLAVGLFGFACTRSPRSWPRIFVFAGTALIGASAVRFVSVFAIATAFVTLRNLDEARPALRDRLPFIGARGSCAIHAVAAAAVCVLLVITATSLWTARGALAGGNPLVSFVSIEADTFAPGAAEYIRSERLPGPIFNDALLGGYLVYALYPEYQLFIDTRNLSVDTLVAHDRARARPRFWRELSRRFGFRTVVLSTLRWPTALGRALVADPEWRLAFVDPHAAVFVRGGAGPHSLRAEWTGTRPPDAVLYVPRSFPGSLTWEREMGLQLLRRYLFVLSELGHFEPVARMANAALARAPEDEGLRRLQLRAQRRLQESKAAR